MMSGLALGLATFSADRVATETVNLKAQVDGQLTGNNIEDATADSILFSLCKISFLIFVC